MTRVAAIAIVALAVMSLAAPATRAAFFVGGALGGQRTDGIDAAEIDDGSLQGAPTIDDTDLAYKVFGGFTILKFLAVEGHYTDLGDVSVQSTSDGTGTRYSAGPVDAVAAGDGYGLNVTGILPLGRLRLWAKVGAFRWSVNTEVTSNGQLVDSDSARGTDPLYGVGLSYNLSRRFSLQLEVERITLDRADVDMATLGLRFGI